MQITTGRPVTLAPRGMVTSPNALASQAWATADETARIELYREAYRLTQADAPWLFLYNPVSLWTADRRIQQALPDWAAGVDGLVLFGQG